MKLLVLSVILLFLFVNMAFADSPARPLPKVTASQHGITYFTMIPRQANKTKDHGVAFKLEKDGTSVELWRVNGWYAFEVFLSNNGEYLVRMGNWASGSEPSVEDLAVSFYAKGIELKSYSTKELIKNKESVKRTVSHYMWQSNDGTFPKFDYDNKFYLKTIEGIVYTFDATTGEISNESHP